MQEFQGKLSKMGFLSQTIPVFSVKCDSKKISLSIKSKNLIVDYSDIRNAYLWLSTGLEPVGMTQDIKYHVDLHLGLDNEEIILEFVHYPSVIKLIDILKNNNINVEDKMGLYNIIIGSEDIEKRKQILKYFKDNWKDLESQYGPIERNRLKNKYVGRF